MSYTITNSIALGTSQTGLTLVPALIDIDGSALPGMTTTGAYEVGMGNYLYTHTVPDDTRGAIVYSVGAVVMAVADVNPEVAGAPLTAAGVWTYPTRELSSFGTLVADIATAVWGAGTRSLTTFGTLVADVWAAGTRTLTSYGSLVTDIWSAGTRSLTTYGTLVSDVTTAVWGAGARTLTSFGTLTTDTATAVWGAGTRTLSSYGTLVADIWGAGTRSLTTFGSLASDVWASGTRTLTDMGTIADDVAQTVWEYGTRTLTSLGTVVSDTATAVWASISRTLTSFGTLAADVDTELSGTHGAGSWVDTGGAGGGAHSVTLTLQDDAVPAAKVVGARVTIKNSAQTAVIAGPQTTNSSGQIVFNLDDGSYKVLVSSTPAYQSLAAQTLTVSGTTTATYTLTRTSTTAPANPNTAVVYGDLVRITGQPAVGVAVTFSLPSTKGAEASDDLIVGVAKTETVTTDAAGRFQVQLLWTSTLTQYAGLSEAKTYLVSCPDCRLTAHFSVGDVSTLDISTLFPPVD